MPAMLYLQKATRKLVHQNLVLNDHIDTAGGQNASQQCDLQQCYGLSKGQQAEEAYLLLAIVS